MLLSLSNVSLVCYLKTIHFEYTYLNIQTYNDPFAITGKVNSSDVNASLDLLL